jgi:hypothetical protein
MWEFLIYSMPWWLQLAIVAVVAAALFLLAVRVLGWERVKGWIMPVAIAIGAGALLSRSRQQGWADKVKKDLAAADKLIDRAARTRAKAEADARQPGKLREKDEFMRDD